MYENLSTDELETEFISDDKNFNNMDDYMGRLTRREYIDETRRDLHFLLGEHSVGTIEEFQNRLHEGRVEGMDISGDCACLVAFLALRSNTSYSRLSRKYSDSAEKAERFVTIYIGFGDGPSNDLAAALLDAWITDHIAARAGIHKETAHENR